MSKIVFRTLDVFESFARHKRALSLTELMKFLDIPISSCHDVVQALVVRGYLYEVKPRGGFYPTARMHELAKVIVDNDPVTERAEPVLQELCLALSASVSLAKARDKQLTYLVVCNPPNPLRFSVTVGDAVRNLYATSAGKALLGSFSPEEQASYLAGIQMTPMTPYTTTSRRKLLAELKASEQRGWYVNREETFEDALTVSTRFTWNGAVYVVTAAGTLTRMDRQLDQAVALLKATASKLQQHEH
jgi:DNA-binding IclR family transcriptional regulator